MTSIKKLPGFALACLAPGLGLTWSPAVEAQERPSLAALPIDAPITVDGRLNDDAWQRAEKGSGFRQREPNDGEPATERTEVQVAYTPSTLYVAIRAWDSAIDEIVAKEMERDAELHRDDSVVVIFDTFHDRRNAYSFETNANSALRDVLVSDEERDINPEWDGVWTSVSRRDAQGWTAEFAIPFSTLRFDPQLDTWGFNVRRMIRHKNEEVNWAHVGRGVGSPRDSTRYPIYRISLAGELTGLSGIQPSQQLDLKPYAIASSNDRVSANTSDSDFDLGIDAKWGLTRSLTLDLTYNTDFAEVEVDEQQVNLTRFSLFFPEKREFFLENAGIFEFGLPNRDAFEPTLMKIFFSRRIGLDGGREVPIDYGARLTGRVGGWNVGVLDVATAATTFDDGTSARDTNFAVIRAKRNLGRRSGVGFILTNRDQRGGGTNRVLGLDVDWKPNAHWDLGAFAAQNDNETPGTPEVQEGQATGSAVAQAARRAADDWAAGYGFGYQRGDLRASFEHSRVTQRFDPGSGFLLRGDYERINPRMRWRPRINRWGIRTWFVEAAADYFERASTGELESRMITFSAIGWRSTREDGWGLNWVGETERLFEPFEISPGIVIPPGVYNFDGWRIGGRSNEGRRVSVRGRVQSGDFFEGTRTAGNLSVNLRASRFFRAETQWGLADVSLPQGQFKTSIYGQKLSFSFSPDLRLNAFLQYNDETELIAANIRFNWIYRPGADLFVVFNQNWDAMSFSQRQTRDRQVIVKFTYLIQR